jgi:hypothetical protein
MLPYSKFPKIKSAFGMVQDIHFYNEIIEIVLSEKSLQRSTRMRKKGVRNSSACGKSQGRVPVVSNQTIK